MGDNRIVARLPEDLKRRELAALAKLRLAEPAVLRALVEAFCEAVERDAQLAFPLRLAEPGLVGRVVVGGAPIGIEALNEAPPPSALSRDAATTSALSRDAATYRAARKRRRQRSP